MPKDPVFVDVIINTTKALVATVATAAAAKKAKHATKKLTGEDDDKNEGTT